MRVLVNDEDDGPRGSKLIAKFAGGEVWRSVGGDIVVLGSPMRDDEGHNCDAMGCGSSHVVWRGR